jgi:hypothetical protein
MALGCGQGAPDEGEASGTESDAIRSCKGPFDCKLPNHNAASTNRATDPANGTARWPILPGTVLYDGFGHPRAAVAENAVYLNYGQRKQIQGTTYVYAFATLLANGMHASGWIPEAKVVDDVARLMPTVSARDPGSGDYSTTFLVTGGNPAAYGDLKVDPRFNGPNDAAADYLVREGNVVNLLYNLPGVGGVSTDTFPIGAPFHRSRGVEAVAIPLYRPGGSSVVAHMTFVYGHVGSRHGWIAHAALTAQ